MKSAWKRNIAEILVVGFLSIRKLKELAGIRFCNSVKVEDFKDLVCIWECKVWISLAREVCDAVFDILECNNNNNEQNLCQCKTHLHFNGIGAAKNNCSHFRLPFLSFEGFDGNCRPKIPFKQWFLSHKYVTFEIYAPIYCRPPSS